jgi:hypothetical protein
MPIGDVILGALRTAQATRGLLLTIRRGDLTTAAVPAVVHRSTWLEGTVEGTIVRIRCRDFLIAAADYRLGGVPVVPQEHDELIETTDKVRTYEALPAAGEGAVRFSDPHYVTHLIHAKQTAEAPLA